MKILFIYRNPAMGFSIGKVFKSIEEEMAKYLTVDSIELPCSDYSLGSLLCNIKAARNAIKKKKYDIVHITGSEHYLLPFLRKYKTVVTVHDLGFYTNNKLGLRTISKYLFWIRTLPLANYITFISEKSECEALKLVDLKPNHYGVIPNPVNSEYVPSPKKINTNYPIILHVGTSENKNLDSTIIALKGFPCRLRIVGKLTDSQKLVLKLYGIDYENVYDLTDADILQEYINCDFVNFPSLYEGFGMPIIEGQAIGRPVLTSCISPMKEVANGSAIIIDPTKPKEIRKGYEIMGKESDSFIQRGLKNVERFALDKITKQYLEVYKNIFKNIDVK